MSNTVVVIMDCNICTYTILNFLPIGIYFNNLDSSNIQYTLRMNPDLDWETDTIEPVFELHGARSSRY